MPLLDTVAAISTPAGQGGIAAIRISGTKSYDVASKVFVPANQNKKLFEMKGYTATFGYFFFREKKIDEGVALCYHAPHSYTGEETVELFCHGGEQVSKEILLACIENGALPAGPGEFTKRAMLNGKMNLTQAEAVMDLISATSAQGLQAANAVLEGVLSDEISQQKNILSGLATHLAAYTDYPEEDVETLTLEEFLTTMQQVKNKLDLLVENYHRGSVIKAGISVVIVGSPNVGKSTLFNLLSGYDRAIVTEIAGTTRDVLREEIQLDGITLFLSDTAGLHETDDIVEAEGIKRSYSELDKANLILAVFDGTKKLSEEDRELAKACEGKPSIALINKNDLGVKMEVQELLPFFKEVLVVSAREKETRTQLEQAVLKIFELEKLDPNQALLANDRQLASVVSACDALQEAIKTLSAGFTFDAAGVYLEDAISALATLTGENVVDTVIDEIFDRFCVGK